jgi:2-phospho-L-lactate guanylyltransferase
MVARSHGGWLALVPVKALPRGKSRLAGVLDGDARADLVLFLLRRVVGACLEAGLAVCVVSPDPEVHAVARALGASTLDDGGRDLSASIALALERHATATGVAVLASDLPHVTASDVLELVAHARPLALVAAADGTTNAIAACPPTAFHPSYGPGSAARHGGTRLRLAGIERDVDTPSDLALACPG